MNTNLASATGVESPPVLPSERPWPPALLISLLCHVILVLLLSLIAYGSGARHRRPSQLWVAQPEETALQDLQTFELEPTPPVSELAVEFQPQLRIPISVTPPPKIELASSINSNLSAKTDSAVLEAQAESAELAVPIRKVALSIQRRVSEAGGKQGEVQFALAWKNVNDVDLHVIAPSGERISHLHKRSVCHGMLDVDMNVKGESTEPVENIRWLSNAPWGRYTVIVNLFRIHRARAGSRVYRGSEFQLLAQLGSQSILEKGIVRRDAQIFVHRFQYIPSSLPSPKRERLLEELAATQAQEETSARPLLERAVETKSQQLRDRLLNNLIIQFPHTDTAIEAMQLLGGNITKR